MSVMNPSRDCPLPSTLSLSLGANSLYCRCYCCNCRHRKRELFLQLRAARAYGSRISVKKSKGRSGGRWMYGRGCGTTADRAREMLVEDITRRMYTLYTTPCPCYYYDYTIIIIIKWTLGCSWFIWPSLRGGLPPLPIGCQVCARCIHLDNVSSLPCRPRRRCISL